MSNLLLPCLLALTVSPSCSPSCSQTGSGKTHSMLGTAGDPGIIPLAIDDIFTAIEAGECNTIDGIFTAIEAGEQIGV